ncbi:hypothetical protein BGZ83_005555 [Gryganskiella cystojenkinii]|nr:hypothetical protein BGZ83_005555 [Gryganskiella cystojenkinii]
MATASSPVIRARNAKYQANVTKRGHVKAAAEKAAGSSSSTKSKASPVSPVLVGFLAVLLCGGALVEILRLFGAGV